MELSSSEKLTYSTIRIECDLRDGGVATGTGFFFRAYQEGDTTVPVIVTNRHVVRDALQGRFLLHETDEDGSPSRAKSITVALDDFETRWFPHPQDDVDLCFMPAGPIINAAFAQGRKPFFVDLGLDLIPTEEELREFTAAEEVLMVGYPNGLWDSFNNMPILRRGITATHPALDYEGRPEFLIDAACFSGSSGSPVLLYTAAPHNTRAGQIVIGTRIKLLGVLYAGPQYTATGEIEVVDIPTVRVPVAASRLPMNLGMVIRSTKLKDFESMARTLLHGAAQPGVAPDDRAPTAPDRG
jgi:hypothetical protein